jgi:hypothetical protein
MKLKVEHFHAYDLVSICFDQPSEILRIRYREPVQFLPLNWGNNFFHIEADIRPKKTQSENHCKYINSVLRTLTKFVFFSNQKVRKYFHL